MLRRRRVAPLQQLEDEYIQRRYEDTSRRIMEDIRRGRGLYSSYVPWVQDKLISFIPDERKREKQWIEQVPLYKTPSNQQLINNNNTRTRQSSVCNLL